MTPTGVAIRMPIPVSTRLPRIALAMPPPSEPGPGVGLVNRVGVKPRTPWTISITRIEPRTRAPTTVAAVQATRRARSATRRPWRTRPGRRWAAGAIVLEETIARAPQAALTRRVSSRAMMSTTKVITNRMQPRAISAFS